jgi:superfamily II RNA helicase
MAYLIQPDLSTAPEFIPSHPYSFPLDPFQQHAIYAISKDENVLVCAKTGSGKTLVGEYQIYHSLSKGKRVFYTTPIKSLSNQKFYDLKKQFSDASIGIMTGDIKFCPDAQVVIMTTEILRNLLYKKGTTTENLGLTASISMEDIDAVIFDECHYINDRDRGKIWEETMILLPPEINMVMLSATLDHPEYLANWLGDLKQKKIHLIQTHYRIVPLIHQLINKKDQFITLMDEKENYNEQVYLQWLRERTTQEKEQYSFQQKVKDSREAGLKGSIDGKVHVNHFIHQMNQTILLLHKKELLPALFFVLSRKQCENYASKIESTLLDSSDTATVKHIISFHLHRYMKDLEKIQQYHQIYDLLCRGIAFHHSGLLPLLKEIIEILFSKGYVKLMFCTETFAVGLNMPTKTVLFGGFKKYDDLTGGMRILRNDEYLQMAGRAGRRGKDDKGIVIYLPDHSPLEGHEMFKMMKGTKPEIRSRMDFHYDFILKTIQSSPSDQPLKWLQIMEKSYWFQQRKLEINNLLVELNKCQKELKEVELIEPYLSDCKKRFELEQELKQKVNSKRKEIQRQLDSLKNKQIGPKWNKAWSDYQLFQVLQQKELSLKTDLAILENHQDHIRVSIEFLYECGYITTRESSELTRDKLSLKGILATEVNEGHSLLMTEIYTREMFHLLSGKEIVILLSCFLERKEKEKQTYFSELQLSSKLKDEIKKVELLAEEYREWEEKWIEKEYEDGYWNLSCDMMEPIMKWLEGEHLSSICLEYELFEGNFIRSIYKMINMIDEWLSMAIYCQHTEMIEKMMEARQEMIRDTILSDSLYLRL